MEFQGSQFKDYLTALDVDQRRTSPYHPQTNGRIERAHRTLKQILRKLTNTAATQWEEQLGPCLWAYRTTIGINGFTPYFLQYGREPGIPQTTLHSSFGVENDATERYLQLADAFNTATKCTEARHYNNARRQRQANITPLQVGDRVVVKVNERVPLDPRWDHPYLVFRIKGSVIFLIDQRTGNRRVVNREKVLPAPVEDWSPVRPRVKRTQRPPRVPPPPAPPADPGNRRAPRRPAHSTGESDTSPDCSNTKRKRTSYIPTTPMLTSPTPEPMDVDITESRKPPGPVTRSMSSKRQHIGVIRQVKSTFPGRFC